MTTPAESSAEGLSIALGILFYPRGGSAQVVRYLSWALNDLGTTTALATGSLGRPGEWTNAVTFFERRHPMVADYTAALAAFERGEDPMDAAVPFHPSYEDRSGVPDRSFARVSPQQAAHQIAAWSTVLDDDRWRDADLRHLHHLTPLQLVEIEAGRPFVTHLHGTDLKFLERVRRGDEEGEWGPWWRERLTEAALASRHVICISQQDRELALDVLGLEADQMTIVPNGVDTKVFDRLDLGPAKRMERWRNWLVDDPQGWDESGVPGTIRYEPAALDAFLDPSAGIAPVILYVGRFLEFKRVPMLIRAYARARPHFEGNAPLVIWGGSPGEWEGEHPHRVAVAEGVADSVFFVGWRGHDELPLGLGCSDVMAAPSTGEPFGQVFLEAMAAGLPVIATSSGGPLAFVNSDPVAPNGWMVPPDEVDLLAACLVEAVNDGDERRRRADNAYHQIRERYAWSAIAQRFIDLYERVLTPVPD
jgi:glycosyltransferase involved in cell wall biosynthesis